MDEMIGSGELIVPKAGPKPTRTISTENLAMIFESIERIEGWTGSMCRGMCAMYFASGLRPSELRLAEYNDLDLKKEKIFVSNPKGKSNWATKVWVDFIRQDMLPLMRYDKERAECLRENGFREAKYLFPNLHWHTGHYSENSFRKVARHISAEAGVDFSLKMFLATLCNLTVNGDLSRLPAMSVQTR
ncbi:MAG TPA: tyrosine-type recombinase/integrase [Methanomassiliicoccaceae archaeon]|jgi:integrase|nr:site-specific integrase [Euryarchaeota archaeon]HPP44345.1 tyrosine-type recombinase/integrase [Methanomassiliicoccaceae archaeon]HPT74075.1 tyrosine-type recombinase/integrase [Methanomassiliicoccaceae archaeon]